jgi:hypothetical protein
MSQKNWVRVHTASCGMWSRMFNPTTLRMNLSRETLSRLEVSGADTANIRQYSAATNSQTGEGVAIKKVTNVFSKKILAKRALREIKLLQHFRGHRNVWQTQSRGTL